uniref:Uncharacterized protein n=1 Tax=Salix viminalis TaxID=40686 RepID=A0A6N2KZ05_SALVM
MSSCLTAEFRNILLEFQSEYGGKEGQVKEKSRWFTSLINLTRKLKVMKMEHIKLSEEALSYKNCVADMEEMSSTIVSTMK